jgi:hypothetical protein
MAHLFLPSLPQAFRDLRNAKYRATRMREFRAAWAEPCADSEPFPLMYAKF